MSEENLFLPHPHAVSATTFLVKKEGITLRPTLMACALAMACPLVLAQQGPAGVTELEAVVVTAETELKQSLGASVITAEDLAKSPPANDISEILRTQPGINLTGNSSSGQRGNNRQIDIRGMGPENTLILIDGKPVNSRSSVRFGWRGERDSRGDTNWVPADQIERIEVLRGPAAARYGSGAAGGVVNIITKPATDTLSGSISTYLNQPQHSEEGSTRRVTFGLSGPLTEKLSFRLYGNVSKTEADDANINWDHRSERGGPAHINSVPAGREGVRNRDLNTVFTLRPITGHAIDFEAGVSRQGNIYTGDTQNTNTNTDVPMRIGSETNRIYRQNYSITHRGEWNADTSTLAYLQYEKTRNTRIAEGLAGGTEGIFNPTGEETEFGDIDLRTLTAHAEVNRHIRLGGMDQVGTLGIEWVEQKLEDRVSDLKVRNPQAQVPVPSRPYDPKARARIFSVFAESNIYVTDAATVTPGLRYDHHDIHGNNWSPSLNLSYALSDAWTVKAGIARAYKAPNLYQSNDGYTLYSAGIGCHGGTGTPGGCYLQGNSNLKAETSVNKELGIQYASGDTQASLTYFRNDYKNKVEAGREVASLHESGRRNFQWENIPKALVSGLEGSLTLPLSSRLLWNTNFTYMFESENKSTGERLTTIPEYTVNTALDWSVNERFSLRAKATFYGEQKPQKFDYHGDRVTGSAADTLSPYALVGFSGRYAFNKTFSVTAGVDNVFDKRLFRKGNASGVTGGGGNYITGAGAHTYNEPGRTYFVNMTAAF